MLKGGYQIINLENRPISFEVGQVYEGIYELIKGTRKPILLSGINIENVEYHDCFAQFKLVDGVYTANIYNEFEVTVSDIDVVTVLNY